MNKSLTLCPYEGQVKVASIFFGLILMLLALMARSTLATETTDPASYFSTAHQNSLCSQWLLKRLDEQVQTQQDFRKVLLDRDSNPPPQPFCKLRALYIITERGVTDRAQLLDQGQAIAVQLLSSRPGWQGISLKDISQYLPQAKPQDARALFWVGYIWGHRLRYMSPFSALVQRRDVVAILQKTIKFDKHIYAGGACTWLGAYYASLPRWVGRDLSKAKQYFEQALEVSDGNLARLVTYAESYLKATNNNERLAMLKRVAEQEPSPDSIWYVENITAHEDARKLLASE
jgi:tetratricopeptide (TPR) repeat protein